MKKIILVIPILFVLISLPIQVLANPKAVVDNPVFEFDPVPEGLLVSSDFTIKNKGTAVLVLEKVSPP